ncbi:uncharacterized protein LOC135818547 [Sycon ciliatum]|uniref:uncharacterized protein LOC135818547 n=1 Tax=Sycon ciliatum TaxID=27933 RepID=UPI0020AD6C75
MANAVRIFTQHDKMRAREAAGCLFREDDILFPMAENFFDYGDRAVELCAIVMETVDYQSQIVEVAELNIPNIRKHSYDNRVLVVLVEDNPAACACCACCPCMQGCSCCCALSVRFLSDKKIAQLDKMSCVTLVSVVLNEGGAYSASLMAKQAANAAAGHPCCCRKGCCTIL